MHGQPSGVMPQLGVRMATPVGVVAGTRNAPRPQILIGHMPKDNYTPRLPSRQACRTGCACESLQHQQITGPLQAAAAPYHPQQGHSGSYCTVPATQLYCHYEQKDRCKPFGPVAVRRWRAGRLRPQGHRRGNILPQRFAAAGVSVEDQLRYPVYGSSNTQRMLYLQNRPDVMANVQQWRMMQFRRTNGLEPVTDPENPQYRAVPKQRSPFRQ